MKKMNIGKSIKISLAEIGENSKWLADQWDLGYIQTCRISSGRCEVDSERIGELSRIFNKTPSEFIKLGEEDV